MGPIGGMETAATTEDQWEASEARGALEEGGGSSVSPCAAGHPDPAAHII